MDDNAQWQRSYEISTDAGEIVFDADYCITPDSKSTPWIAQAAVCPPCSKRDDRADGNLISEPNPYVTEGHSGDGPDSPALFSTCNHAGRTLGTAESSLPAAGDTELASSSSSSPSEEQFSLHSDIDATGLQVAAAAPAPALVSNDRSYIYVDPLKNTINNNVAGSTGSSDGSSSSFDFPYIDQFDPASAYRTPTASSESTTPIIPEQANFAIQGRRKMRKRAE